MTIDDFRIFSQSPMSVIQEEVKIMRKSGTEPDMNRRLAKRLCDRGLEAQAYRRGIDIKISRLNIRLECKRELISNNTLKSLFGQIDQAYYDNHYGNVVVIIYGQVDDDKLEKLLHHARQYGARTISGFKVKVLANNEYY